jgi:glycosyltransferase involved in cell wall biosynthesis
VRALHIVKTSDGGRWAALQVRELVRSGIQVDVALPTLAGRAMDLWRASGARLHAVDLNFPALRLWETPAVLARARRLVEKVRPDVIHSHFVSTTLTLRAALGRDSRTPRFFQVPGPLHLEHWLFRNGELASAGPADYWIAASRYTRSLYARAGVPSGRLFLSYYAVQQGASAPASGLRARLGIPGHAFVVGNINMFYGPKRYLGQWRGLKGHEDVIEALRIVTSGRPDVYGVLAGGPWGGAGRYFEKLRGMAEAACPGRILLPGLLVPTAVSGAWKDFDCAVHVPLSENCGGVVEPLLAGIPVIAGRVGGLPEVVLDGVTGLTVPTCDPQSLAQAILSAMANTAAFRQLARRGRRLAAEMFSARRTGAEIARIYEHVLGAGAPRPEEFDPESYVQTEARIA